MLVPSFGIPSVPSYIYYAPTSTRPAASGAVYAFLQAPSDLSLRWLGITFSWLHPPEIRLAICVTLPIHFGRAILRFVIVTAPPLLTLVGFEWQTIHGRSEFSFPVLLVCW